MPARQEKPTPPQDHIVAQSLKSTLELIGDPKRVAQELKEFSERMRREIYDPMPDKTLILGRQSRIRRAA